jgi:hypothetical protein
MKIKNVGESILDPINLDDPGFNHEQLKMLDKAFSKYAEYCRAKSVVAYCRANNQECAGYEDWCEEIYNRMPIFARWRD